MTRRRISCGLLLTLLAVTTLAAQTTIPGGTIAVDTTWGLAGSPYIVTGNLTVAGTDGGDGVTTLTIEPGVEVRMQGFRVLYVGSSAGGDPGALIADGDAAGGPATITFRSDSATPGVGDWQQIWFRPEAAGTSLLRNVVIRHAGSGSYGALYLNAKAGTTLVVEDVTIEQPSRYGIYQQYGDSSLSEITITDPGDSGIFLINTTSSLSQISVSGGAEHAIDLYSTVDFTLDGCNFASNANHDIRVGNTVTGTVQNCTSIESVWYAPYSTVTWTGNTFNNWGARTSRIGAADLGGLIADNTINKVGGAAVEVTTSTLTLDSVWNDSVGNPYVIVGNFYVEGTDGGDGVTTLQIDPGMELRFDGSFHLYVGGNSAAAPGALIADGDGAGGPATITFTSNQPSPAAGDWGKIHLRAGAQGSSILRNVLIRYGAYGSNAALWMDHGAGVNISLENVAIRDAGGYGIYKYRGDLTASDLTIENTGNYGLYLSGGQTDLYDLSVHGSATNGLYVYDNQLTIDGCALGSNGSHDINIGNYSDVTVQNCSSIESIYHDASTSVASFASNTFNNWGQTTSRLSAGSLGGLIANNTINKVGGATVEVSVGTVATDADWTDAVGHPYTVLGTVTVEGNDGADDVTTLTLEPGIELRNGVGAAYYIGGSSAAIPGALIADGDGPGGPATIVFTSNSATPAAGNWQKIYFRAGARGNSVLRNLLLEYGGMLHANLHLMHAAGTTISVDNVTIRDGNNNGITEGQGNVVMNQVTVTDVASYGIYLGSGSATLSDVTITGAGQYGLYLYSSDIDLDGCAIHGNGNHDIYVANSVAGGTIQNCSSLESFYYSGATHDITWSGNTFNSWGFRTSKITANEVGRLATLNTFNAVPGAILEVDASATLSYDATWTPDPGPYKVVTAAGLTVLGTDGPDGVTTLTLDPGVAIKFLNGGRIDVGAGSGNPGELIVDGRLGGDAYSTVNLTSAKAVPATGDWGGIQVNATGRAELHEAQIRYVTKGLYAYTGTLGPVDRLIVNRADTGLDLYRATLEQPISRTTFKNCDIAVDAYQTNATIRNSDLVGASWGVQNSSAASYCVDAATNWWNATNGPSGNPPAAGCEVDTATGSGSPISDGVIFDNWLDAPSDDGDGIPCDDGDGFFDPCNAGNLIDCDDNCCIVANISQEDLDYDGVGDACDDNPVLRVSNDPADGADFDVIQDAVDAAFQSGTRVEIYPGLGTYGEAVRLDRLPPQVFAIAGLDTGGGPVVVDGGPGPAFGALDKPLGVVPMRFENLTLQGAQGIYALVDTEMTGMTFEMISLEAVELDAGNHEMDRIEIRDTVTTGVNVATGATLQLSRAAMTGQSDAGLIVAGTATVENTLIDNGVDGLRLAASGSVDVLFSTIADNTGAGIDNSQGGAYTVDRSIVCGNTLADLLPTDVGTACPAVTWSDTLAPDCSAAGNNISADPQFDVDYRLLAGSACLDHGPDPATYTGDPPTDLAGQWRLADYDGDGMAQSDPGAYERVNTHVPGEVQNLVWESWFRMVWDVEPDAIEYHAYRDDLSNLSLANFGLCSDPIDPVRTDTWWDDATTPAQGQGFFYLVTADDGGNEGTLGFGKSAERSNFDVCP